MSVSAGNGHGLPEGVGVINGPGALGAGVLPMQAAAAPREEVPAVQAAAQVMMMMLL